MLTSVGQGMNPMRVLISIGGICVAGTFGVQPSHESPTPRAGNEALRVICVEGAGEILPGPVLGIPRVCVPAP